MITYPDCPFLAAFVAMKPVLEHADPGGTPAEMMEEYGFAGTTLFLGARAAAEAGLGGAWRADEGEMGSVLAALARFAAGWEDSMQDSGKGGAALEAARALEEAAVPEALAALGAGFAAGAAVARGGAAFRPAAGLAAEAGLSGVPFRAFVSGFCAALPDEGLRLDPVSGAVLRPALVPSQS